MPLDELAWKAALAHYNKEFDEAEPFDNYYPPDNDYTVMVAKVKRGVSQKDDKPFMWWKIMVTAIAQDHPEVDGQDFQLAFMSSKMFGGAKTTCNKISQNTAKRSIDDYDAEMDSYIGTFLTVRVHREVNQKSGKTYVAVDIIDVIPPQETGTPGSEGTAESAEGTGSPV